MKSSILTDKNDRPILIKRADRPAKSTSAPVAESPLADFATKYLAYTPTEQARVDLPRQIGLLATSQQDTQAVIDMVFAAGAKSWDGKTLLGNTIHHRLWTELRERLAYNKRKGIGADVPAAPVSETQVTAPPPDAQAPLAAEGGQGQLTGWRLRKTIP